MIKLKTFEETINELKKCLNNEKYPENIQWVFLEDLIIKNNIMYVKNFSLSENVNIARDFYNSINSQKYGLELKVLSITKHFTYCSIIIPVDKRDTEERIIEGLKISLPIKMPEAKIINSSLRWKMIRMNNVSQNILSELVQSKLI